MMEGLGLQSPRYYRVLPVFTVFYGVGLGKRKFFRAVLVIF